MELGFFFSGEQEMYVVQRTPWMRCCSPALPHRRAEGSACVVPEIKQRVQGFRSKISTHVQSHAGRKLDPGWLYKEGFCCNSRIASGPDHSVLYPLPLGSCAARPYPAAIAGPAASPVGALRGARFAGRCLGSFSAGGRRRP